MRSRHRRDPPSLLTVLRLARQVQREPEQRAVLHDALLERYGDDYEWIVADAISYAYLDKRPWVVLLQPTHLTDAERNRTVYSWAERRRGVDVKRRPLPFFVRPIDYRGLDYQPKSKRAVITFVAEPGLEEPEERPYHLRGWERGRR